MNDKTLPFSRIPAPITCAGSLADSEGRRELPGKPGKVAGYAAPFTVLAFAKKADAATGIGPVKHVHRK